MAIIEVNKAIEKLRAGNVVGVPTETVYGLAGLIGNDNALRKIFTVKDRPFFDPLIVHVLNVESAKQLAREFPPVFEELADHFWPGPLTLVCPKKSSVSDLITSGLPTVALRSPDHKVAQKILDEAGPFAAPSANRFGRTSPTAAAHVIDEFQNQVDVVDGGPCTVGLESTVVELLGDCLSILRPGRILKSDLASIADRYALTVNFHESNHSPGHLKHHYQPEVPLILVRGNIDEQTLREKIADTLKKTDFVFQQLLLPSDPRHAARILYAELRRLSQNPKNIIVAQPAQWGWKSDDSDLMDRLNRAALMSL